MTDLFDRVSMFAAFIGLLTTLTGALFTANIMGVVQLKKGFKLPIEPDEQEAWRLWEIATGQHHVPASGLVLGWHCRGDKLKHDGDGQKPN